MISKNKLAQIILDFKEWQAPEVMERDLPVDIDFPLNRAITIIGPRRTGKTYLMYSVIKKLLANKISRQRILYINFETPGFLDAEASDLESIYDVFKEINQVKNNEKIWLFFDEIQTVQNWETGIRSLLDKGNNKIFLTGSSSKMLSREIATNMRGRTLSLFLLPYSFAEFLRFKAFKSAKYYSSAEENRLNSYFEQYFNFGGYPEAVIDNPDWEKIMTEIQEVTIYRDLIERNGIRNIKAVKLMMNQLVRAKEFSVHKFYKYLTSMNIKVSKNTLYDYLEYFRDAFVFFPLYKYSPSMKSSEQSIPKIYPVDNAFLSLVSSEDKGKKLETLVFLQLLRKGFEPSKSLFYYANGAGEVDFVIKEKDKIKQLIQVCYDTSDYNTRERELKTLLKAAEVFNCNNLLVITREQEKIERHERKQVVFLPVIKWLMEE